MLPDAGFWQGKRVLLTGHTGFKGSWLALWLARLGAHVTGLALAPPTMPSLFDAARVRDALSADVRVDIRDAPAVAQAIRAAQPDIVLHLAAQALVRQSYRDPLATYATNVMGTAHVLDALRELPSVRVAVMVTTDKVYRNLEQPYPYREDDALGGHDPYSASKAASELVIASYRSSWLDAQGVAVASARAGNVIGGGDWAADRLIPDAVRAWQAGQTLVVRAPHATRPWQHVLEPLAGYLVLAQRLWHQPTLAGAYNFGPPTHEAATVKQVIDLASSAYPESSVSYQNESNSWHEAGWLALEVARTRAALGVQSRWSLAQAVQRTLAWYRAHQQGADAQTLCHQDMVAYQGAAE
ncbi:MAG: CDP-glucose 4,6-dehydratase [Rhodoferax sp.]